MASLASVSRSRFGGVGVLRHYPDSRDFSFREKKNQAFGISDKVQFFGTILYWCSMNIKHKFLSPFGRNHSLILRASCFRPVEIKEGNTS